MILQRCRVGWSPLRKDNFNTGAQDKINRIPEEKCGDCSLVSAYYLTTIGVHWQKVSMSRGLTICITRCSCIEHTITKKNPDFFLITFSRWWETHRRWPRVWQWCMESLHEEVNMVRKNNFDLRPYSQMVLWNVKFKYCFEIHTWYTLCRAFLQLVAFL